jgi:hypothetical protein
VTKSVVKEAEACLLIWRLASGGRGTVGNQVFCSLHR